MIFSLLFRFSGLFLSFLLNVYLAKEVDKEILGHYFWLTQLMIILSILIRCGLDVAILKYGALLSKKQKINFINIYVSRVILPFFIGCLVMSYISFFLLEGEFFDSIIFVCLSVFPFTLFNLISEYFKSVNKQSIATVVQACLLPVFMYVGMKIFHAEVFVSYSVSVLIVFFIALIIFYVIIRNDASNDEAEFKYNFKDEIMVFFTISILNVVITSMDVIILGVFSTKSVVAEYSVASKLVLISSVLLISVNGVLGPRFSRLWHENKHHELKCEFLRSIKLMSLSSIIVFGVFFFLGESILSLLYGEQYIKSYGLLVVLAFGQSIVLATGPVAYLLMMTNSKKVHRQAMYLSLVVNIILNFTLIPVFGAIGAAFATASSLIFKNIYCFWHLFKIFKVEKYEHE
ncbi:oligosaccharide flippase family protein [Enterovibrio norvegicus]|uniref:lipopolysaccharide biosynthesis protein n=1 Tax=Enterovibrio norvegicus TaxID=188144 RepID=UPI003D0B69CF